jgi:tryptophan 7-halogenase
MKHLLLKIALYKHCGRIFREDAELFQETSWFAVLQGQGIFPQGYDTLADVVLREH